MSGIGRRSKRVRPVERGWERTLGTALVRQSLKRVAIIAAVAVFVLAGAVAVVAHVMAFDPDRLASALREAESRTGIRIALGSSFDFAFFPRPNVLVRDVRISDRDGTVDLHAPSLRVTLSTLALLRGQIVIDGIRAASLTGSIDIDRLPFGGRRTSEAQDGTLDWPEALVPSTVVVASAFLQLRSSNPAQSGFLTDLHGVLEGLREGRASATGGGLWHGERGDVSVHLDSVATFMGAEPTEASVKIRSSLLTASASGTLNQGWRGGFMGDVTATSPAFPTLLRIVGLSPGILAGVQHASFSSNAEPTSDGLAFANAKVVLNDSALEGTLALQFDGDRTGIVGTLATERLDLTPLIAALPAIRDGEGGWSETDIAFSPSDLHDVDLRISANHLRVDGIEADDAALSALCREGRMELSLGEARAYGGLVKARLFANDEPNGLAFKLDASWSQLDFGGLSNAAQIAPDHLAGTANGHFTIEGHGRTASAIVGSLAGSGEASLRQGKLADVPLIDALIQPDPALRADAAARGTPTAFDLASLDFQIADGSLTIARASIAGPDMHVSFSGTSSLPQQTYRLSSKSAVRDGATALSRSQPTAFHIAGVWGGPMHQLAPDVQDDGGLSLEVSPAAGELP